MAPSYCPGQDRRFWTHDDISDLDCPACGHEIEFFKDDGKRKCPNCGTVVTNPRVLMSCASWCAYAEECVGTASGGGDSFEAVSAALIHWLRGRGNLGREAAEEMYDAGRRGDEVGGDTPYPLSALKLAFILCRYLSLIGGTEIEGTEIEGTETVERLVREAEDFLNGYAVSGQVILKTAELVRELHEEWEHEGSRNPDYLRKVLRDLADPQKQ
jgi:predicted RNA-binding Zn-ribbon protein involved in translation (DUF1610 family)